MVSDSDIQGGPKAPRQTKPPVTVLHPLQKVDVPQFLQDNLSFVHLSVLNTIPCSWFQSSALVGWS